MTACNAKLSRNEAVGRPRSCQCGAAASGLASYSGEGLRQHGRRRDNSYSPSCRRALSRVAAEGAAIRSVPGPRSAALKIPELVSQDGKLHATIMLNNNVQRKFLGAKRPSQCCRRTYGIPWCERNPSGLRGSIPPGFQANASPPSYPGLRPFPLANTSIRCRVPLAGARRRHR